MNWHVFWLVALSLSGLMLFSAIIPPFLSWLEARHGLGAAALASSVIGVLTIAGIVGGLLA